MGMRELEYQGLILADTMGLGKTIQAIALLWTLLRMSKLPHITRVSRSASSVDR